MIAKKIAIASDHAGVELKSKLKVLLEDMGAEIVDFGTNSDESVDYPDYAEKVARAIISGEVEKGVLICGTGIGISIAANRHKEIRAALCCSARAAEMTRLHNDANILALGARMLSEEEAVNITATFFATEFEGGRHQKRINKMS